MKLRNIFTLLSFLVLAASCSMEDDVLNEMTKSDPQDNSDQTEVSLSFNLNVNGINTRANEIKPGDDGDMETVTNCSVILFEGDKVIGVYDESEATLHEPGGYNLSDARFLVKSGREYEVYIIGDTKVQFANCATKAEVEVKAFGAEDLAGKVKFGKKDFTAEKGTSTALNGVHEVGPVTVELSNLTAQIRLMDVVGELKEGESSGAVQLTKVELLNKNTAYTLLGNTTATPMTLSDEEKTLASPFTIENRDWDLEKTTDIAAFATFPNTDGGYATQIRLTFKVGSDETQTRTYTINRPNNSSDEGRGTTSNGTTTTYVNPGYIYQLYAKVKLIGDQVDCTLQCYTRDWLYNEVEVIMID